MVMTIIVAVAALAVAIFLGTWAIQIAAVVLVLAFRILIVVVVHLGYVVGALMWVGWWLTSPKTAMAALRQKNRVYVDKTPPAPSPYGEKPFRRRRSAV